jgi:16S rRNA C967 or C1407 C5-methylase (RsmB/RsmF family)
MKHLSKKKNAGGGAALFDSYYRALFGERWTHLREALLQPTRQCTWQHSLCAPYYLDSGSVYAALSLPIAGCRALLDLCAAPGGKTLVLSTMMDADATLVSNERSSERRARLHQVIDASLPPEVRAKIRVTGSDGARRGKNAVPEYDAILLDAPCSSERHVLASPAHLDVWTPARVRNLAHAQWALLSAAYRMLLPGGYVLYATCALSPAENDGVMERLFQKYPDARSVPTGGVTFPSTFTDAALTDAIKPESTRYGRHILPDTSEGAGPLYFALAQNPAIQ